MRRGEWEVRVSLGQFLVGRVSTWDMLSRSQAVTIRAPAQEQVPASSAGVTQGRASGASVPAGDKNVQGEMVPTAGDGQEWPGSARALTQG